MEEIEHELSCLRAPQSTDAFGEIVCRLADMLGEGPLFEGRHWKAWQEAYIAWRFAKFDGAYEVQLTNEYAPDDFLVRRDGTGFVGFQATEAQLQGRKRTEEYRSRRRSGLLVHEQDAEHIQAESDGALPSVLNALRKKALTARGGRLVVYWNTGWLIDGYRFVAGLEGLSAPYRNQFSEAWVLGKGSVFRVAPYFEMVAGPPISLGRRI